MFEPQRLRRHLQNNIVTSWYFADEFAIDRTNYTKPRRVFVLFYSLVASMFITAATTDPAFNVDRLGLGLLLTILFHIIVGTIFDVMLGVAFIRRVLKSFTEVKTTEIMESSKNDDTLMSKTAHVTSFRIELVLSFYICAIIILLFAIVTLLSRRTVEEAITTVYISIILFLGAHLVTKYFQEEIVLRHSFPTFYNRNINDGADLVDALNPKTEIPSNFENTALGKTVRLLSKAVSSGSRFLQTMVSSRYQHSLKMENLYPEESVDRMTGVNSYPRKSLMSDNSLSSSTETSKPLTTSNDRVATAFLASGKGTEETRTEL